MDDLTRIRDIKKQAQARLRAILGVHAVGVGPKISGGKHTGQPSIIVLVKKKKPLAELSPDEVVPAEIDGVKTDIQEAEEPRLLAGEDTSSYRPLRGGIQIQPGGGLGGKGTLAFFARTTEPVPRIFALTCEHVVGTAEIADFTDLVASSPPGPLAVALTGPNTKGAVIELEITLFGPAGDPTDYLVFQYAPKGMTANDAATAIAAKINALKIPGGLTASAAAGTVKITFASGYGLKSHVYSLHAAPKDASIRAQVKENVITLFGEAKADCAGYIGLNLGGLKPTYGVFVPIAKGDGFTTVAKSIAKAINDRALAGVSATVALGDVTVNGVEEIECDFSSDVRVGQPTDAFCSKCCCCYDGIGRVTDARIDLDAAMVQLDPGTKYLAEIQDIGPITGSHFVTDAETIGGPYNVQKRGRTTGWTKGTIAAQAVDGTALHQTSDVVDGVAMIGVFRRHYTDAIKVDATSGAFAMPGDSGAALLNDAREVVGIVFAGIANGGIAWAQPVEPTLTAFGLTIETAAAAGVVKTVPDPGMHFAAIEPEEAPFASAVRRHLEHVQREITATPTGREYAKVARRHAEEAVQLVNTNRRVATVWHRNGGPEILQAALSATSSPERKLPDSVQGRPLAECLSKIQRVFMRYASAAFVADLERLGPRLIEFAGLTYPQTLTALNNDDSR